MEENKKPTESTAENGNKPKPLLYDVSLLENGNHLQDLKKKK